MAVPALLYIERPHFRSIRFGGAAWGVLLFCVLVACSRSDPAADNRNLLNSTDPNERLAAAARLGNQEDEAAVEDLVKALSDADERVAKAAAESLAKIGGKATAAALENAIKTTQGNARVLAIGAIAHVLLADAVPTLLPLLGDPEPAVRTAALHGLPAEPHQQAASGLVDALLAEPDPLLRVQMLSKLKTLGAWNQEPEIVLLTRDPPALRLQALEGLLKGPAGTFPRMHKLLAVLLESQDLPESVAWAALEAVASSPAPEAAATVRMFLETSTLTRTTGTGLRSETSAAREKAFELLEKHGATCGAILADMLSSNQESALRRLSAKALGRIGGPAAVEALYVAARKDEAPEVAAAATVALAALRDPRAVELMLGPEANRTRRAIGGDEVVRALSAIGPAAAEPLGRVIRDSTQSELRLLAVRALAAIAEGGNDSLYDATQGDRPAAEKQAAAEALLERKDARAITALVSAGGGEALDLAGQLTDAAARIGTPAIEQIIAQLKDESSDAHLSFAAAEALGSIGGHRAVEALHETATAMKDRPLGWAAALALAKAGDARAVPLLLSAKSVDLTPYLADLHGLEDSITALGPDAVAPLVKILEDRRASDKMRRVAAALLGRLGDRVAEPALLRTRKRGTEELRNAANTALGELKSLKDEYSDYAGRDPFAYDTAEAMLKGTAGRECSEKELGALAKVSRLLDSGRSLDDSGVLKMLKALSPCRAMDAVQSAVPTWAAAVASFVRAAKGLPPLHATLQKADRLYEKGDFGKAGDAYTRVLQKSPAHLDARSNLALTWLRRDQDLLAQVHWEVARILDPAYAPAKINLTVVYERMGGSHRALADRLAQESATLPYAQAAYNAAWYHALANRFGEARALLDPLVALGLNPKFRRLERSLGLGQDAREATAAE